jgi:hypothetical protein
MYDLEGKKTGQKRNNSKFKVLLGRKASWQEAEEAIFAYESYLRRHLGLSPTDPAPLAEFILHPDNGGTSVRYGIESLGAFIGSDDFIKDSLRKFESELKLKFERLRLVTQLHQRLLLTQSIAPSWITHLLRLHAPDLTEKLAIFADSQLRSAFDEIFGAVTTTAQWDQVTTTRRFRGGGMPDLPATRLAAYVASSSKVRAMLEKSGFTEAEYPNNPWLLETRQMWQNWRARAKQSPLGKWPTYAKFLEKARCECKLQSKLLVAHNKRKGGKTRSTLHQFYIEEEERIFAGKMIGGRGNLALNDPSSRFFSNEHLQTLLHARFHLGTPNLANLRCDCGAKLSHGFVHLYSCPQGLRVKDLTINTDVVEIFRDAAAEANITFSTLRNHSVMYQGVPLVNDFTLVDFPGHHEQHFAVKNFHAALSVNAQQPDRNQPLTHTVPTLGQIEQTVEACVRNQANRVSNLKLLAVTKQGLWSDSVSKLFDSFAGLTDPASEFERHATIRRWCDRLSFTLLKRGVTDYYNHLRGLRSRQDELNARYSVLVGGGGRL